MLNIGRLSPGAADYYVAEVATSAEDYYTGKGESAGRWVGSLAPTLGLSGTVDPGDFRAVLDGRHPHTGEHLVPSRTARCRAQTPDRAQPTLFDDDALDVPRAAARLKLSTRHVRRLLAIGHRGANGPVAPDRLLLGRRVSQPGRRGPAAWSVPRVEVERFEAARRVAKARPGYDLTLRPPKSVSVLWALAPEAQRRLIRDAHREAVDSAVAYLETHALFARRGGKGRGRVETDGMVAAAFDHRTSRAGDPLLHTHVVCANVTFTADGDWRAVDGRGLYEQARPGGFVYQAQLRHALARDLGVRFATVRNGWAEVEGVPADVIRAFSKRRDEIEELVAESGYTSALAQQAATLASRAAKEYGVDASALEQRWRDEAAALGFGPAEVAATFDHAQPEPPQAEAVLAELAGPLGLTERASTFSRPNVVEAVAERIGPGHGAGEVERLTDRFLASPSVQPLAPSGTSELVWRRDGTATRSDDLARFSTPELLGLESRLLGWAADGFATPVPKASLGAVEAILGRRPELSDEQVAMVRAVCGDSPAIQAIAGRPGAGKTFATSACVEAFCASGVPVVGAALSATAAAELESAASLGEQTGRPASTIARLLIDLDREGLAPGTVVFVDEASMASTRDLARLAEYAAGASGALKLVGDPDQHGPVETGGLFHALVAAQADSGVRLVENNRQRDPEERAAVHEFREGLIESALSRYDAAGRVVRSATAGESYERMVADWFSGVSEGGSDPMIAGPNSVRHALNRRARALLKADGHLDGPAIVAAEREFCVGDWIVTRKNARSLRSTDGRGFVKNGSAGRVADLDVEGGSLVVDFANEGRIRVPNDYLAAGWVEHGYARTTYGVQGATLERALYHAGDESSFEEGYVALTRAAGESRIYLVDGTLLADDEMSHRAHEQRTTGLATVCESLERRRTKSMAHDADPLAAATGEAFAGWTLRQLAAEQERLETILSAAPSPIDRTFAAVSRQRDTLLTKRRAWEERLGASERALNNRGRWARRVGRDPLHDVRTASLELERLDRTIVNLDRRIEALNSGREERRLFLAKHAQEVARLDLVHRAEQSRALQVRISARLEPSVIRSASQSEGAAARQAWTAVGEMAAIHRDTWLDDGSGKELRPSPSVAERRSYERVESVRRAALAFADREVRVAEELDVTD